MATDTKITDAYETIEAAEKQAILDAETAKKAYNDAIDAIVARFPANGAMTPARVYLSGAKGIGNEYQLTTVKQQYGLVEQVTTGANALPQFAPATTSSGTNG